MLILRALHLIEASFIRDFDPDIQTQQPCQDLPVREPLCSLSPRRGGAPREVGKYTGPPATRNLLLLAAGVAFKGLLLRREGGREGGREGVRARERERERREREREREEEERKKREERASAHRLYARRSVHFTASRNPHLALHFHRHHEPDTPKRTGFGTPMETVETTPRKRGSMLFKMLPLSSLASSFTRDDGLVIDGMLNRPTCALRPFPPFPRASLHALAAQRSAGGSWRMAWRAGSKVGAAASCCRGRDGPVMPGLLGALRVAKGPLTPRFPHTFLSTLRMAASGAVRYRVYHRRQVQRRRTRSQLLQNHKDQHHVRRRVWHRCNGVSRGRLV